MLNNKFLSILFLLLTSASFAMIESDSGVPNPKFETIQSTLSKLQQTFPKQAKVIEYGRTLKGRTLTLMRISGGTKRNAKAIEVSGAIHGNEFLGIEVNLIQYFLSNQKSLPGFTLFLASGGVAYFVPVVNPDGYSDRERENDAGKDLNRDFDVPPMSLKKFTQPETRSLASYLDQDLKENNLKLAFSLDYHCCQGSMIMPWGYKDAHPSQEDLVKFNEIGDIQKKNLGFMVGNPADTVGYNAVGNSADYFYSTYGTFAFAIEGQRGGEESRLMNHVAMLDSIFRKLAEDNFKH